MIARGLMFIGAVALNSLAYDSVNLMDDDNFVTTLTAKIQITTALIRTVRKPLVESTVLAR